MAFETWVLARVVEDARACFPSTRLRPCGWALRPTVVDLTQPDVRFDGLRNPHWPVASDFLNQVENFSGCAEFLMDLPCFHAKKRRDASCGSQAFRCPTTIARHRLIEGKHYCTPAPPKRSGGEVIPQGVWISSFQYQTALAWSPLGRVRMSTPRSLQR